MVNLRKNPEEMSHILATDVGSTTTKARFFRRTGNEWRFLVAGEAPTTVEAPYEDVTLGVRNAVREVEELTGHQILSSDGSGVMTPCVGTRGVDLYCTTSSAGGGLQMMVAGLVKTMSTESANRAALGAGAIVMDVLSQDDELEAFEKIQRIRDLRPDMILLAGGADGGADHLVIGMAELINAAKPLPRLGASYKLPLVYAGNKMLHTQISTMMEGNFNLTLVDNIRPVLEVENTEPARRAIHELFMEHVMSHAPGYGKLMKWTDFPIMPTPAGEGLAMQLLAKAFGKNVIGVGLGGATTNVYSVFDGKFVRSVSANLGMSYSICNVLKETGIANITRWLPFHIDENDARKSLMNKMIRPTTIPQTLQDLMVEHAVSREALRLGLLHHKSIATRLKGVQRERDVSRFFDQGLAETYVDMMKIDIVAGTGGLLSHAPRRIQSLWILNDAFQLEGLTWLFQDSVFMMPHLGLLSTIHPDAAWQIFDKDCLVRLGTVIAPKGISAEGQVAMSVKVVLPDETTKELDVKFGEIALIPLPERTEAKIVVSPSKTFDMGQGPGQSVDGIAMGGKAGLVLDGRGRPLLLPAEEDTRIECLLEWYRTLGLYSPESLEELKEGGPRLE